LILLFLLGPSPGLSLKGRGRLWKMFFIGNFFEGGPIRFPIVSTQRMKDAYG